MTKVVLGDLSKIDQDATLENIEISQSVGSAEATYILAATPEKLEEVSTLDHEIYLPSTLLNTNAQNIDHLHVYFDLENYPFYQRAKEIIAQETKPKGVFRFRRMVKQDEDRSRLVSDLYVLSSLLGELKDVQVKQTDQSTLPAHTIIMVNFGGGTMAHIEYTISDQERIEFEWSGIENIIEFNSDKLESIESRNLTSLPLVYSVDSILEQAHQVDQTLIDRLKYLSDLLNRGEGK